MNGVEGGTANALGSPCHTDRYQPIADRDVSLTLPSGTSIRVRTVGESAITYFDLVYPYPGTYQALAEFYSQEADIFINGVRLFGFEDTWVQVVKEVGADCSDPHSWITHWLDYKTLVGVSTYDSQESTVTIAPGVRMHRNYTEELEDGTTLVRGIWIENLPARTVDVTIGEVRARLNCSNINTD
jgi:hypothetical protein